MKQKHLLVIIFLFIVVISSASFLYLTRNDNQVMLNEITENKVSSMYAIKLEDENGNYVSSSTNEWNIEDYELNEDKTICDNGIKPIINDDGTITVSDVTGPVKCTLFFDKVPTLAEIIIDLSSTNNHIYHHDGTITEISLGIGEGTTSIDANDGSYRYAGGNSTVNDNYVCFGYDKTLTESEISSLCSESSFATSDYAYRIIGIFKDIDGNNNNNYYVKLIKATVYNNTRYAWNNSSTDKNTFNNSTLFSHILNSKSDSTSSAIELDSGQYYTLKQNGWDGFMAIPVWIVGGISNNDRSNVKSAYTAEMITTGSNSYGAYGASATNNKYKIGLMYINDYGYAASSNYWTTSLVSYNIASGYNWLYNGNEWTITRYFVDSTGVYNIYNGGYITSDGANTNFAIRPVLYLASNVKLDKTNMNDTNMGIVSNPYRLKM